MRRLPLLLLILLLLPAAVVLANTSHAGWPNIDGALKINKQDQSTPLHGQANRHNELLGGHGSDTIYGGSAGDVLWGDYKPCCQPTTQVDHIFAGPGNDFIYTSHGTNYVHTGGGRDVVHAHFGRGEIFCDSSTVMVFMSHVSRRRYRLHGCTHVSL